jgi:hypothetical protein
MNFFKRIVRWIDWKMLSPNQRALVATLARITDGKDAWEVKQFKKETCTEAH